MVQYMIEGNLLRLKGQVKSKIGQLLNNHTILIDGNRDQLTGKIQIDYGVSLNEAKIVTSWQNSIY
jgi:uncharacterized protein YjbJ (UPF0337 family)